MNKKYLVSFVCKQCDIGFEREVLKENIDMQKYCEKCISDFARRLEDPNDPLKQSLRDKVLGLKKK